MKPTESEVTKIINLKEKPFNLNAQQIGWVEDTIKSMTLDEKIGQLFVHMCKGSDEATIKKMTEVYHVGGIRFMENQAEHVFRMINDFQKHSRIPLFAACNLEAGAHSAVKEGTLVATHAQCGAGSSLEAAYQLGRISGTEAAAVGCNWNFGPIADIAFNWRNTIINSRSFANEPHKVLDCSRAYLKGIQESRMLSCAKHFPGDGVDERDQHLVMSVNDLSCEAWDASFGLVYKELIEDGLESIMVGHIALPSYEKKLNPQIQDHEIKPATLSPEIVNGLLRTQLGFEGLVITDASHMGGLLGAMQRRELVPRAIAAGCDMFLFVHDAEEDIKYMKNGYESGIISEERLQDALMRILGMKAKLGLHQMDFKAFAQNSQYEAVVGCQAHKEIAQRIADDTITLVKDTVQLLPISVEKHKRARLYYLETAPKIYSKGTDPVKHIVKEELERAGFTVDLNESLYDLECRESSPMNIMKVMGCPSFEAFRKDYDVVFVFIHMSGYAQENNVRLKYSMNHSNELPWWIQEVPTIGVSLNFTNHLYDIPMLKTFIHAYAPSRECIRAAIDKIVGKSPFTGIANENVWCGRMDTRY